MTDVGPEQCEGPLTVEPLYLEHVRESDRV